MEMDGGSNSIIESMWVKLSGLRSNVIVMVCYRPPDQKLEGDLEMRRQIREMSKMDRNVIMGDFNFPHIDWVNVLSQEKETRFLACQITVPWSHLSWSPPEDR